MEMLQNIWKFLDEKFQVMPTWVQITAYLAFLATLIISFFNPRYIDMRLVSELEGDQFPIGNAIVEVEVGDRVLSMITNEKGRFSVPVSFANPISSYVFVLRPDSKNKNRLKDITVPGKTAYSRWTKLIYHQKSDSCFLSSLDPINILDFFPAAYAQEAVKTNGNSIEKDIISSLSKATGLPANSISPETEIFSDLQLGNIEISYVNHVLHKKYGISIWEKAWAETNTVEDIVKLATQTYYQNVLHRGYEKNRFATTGDLLYMSKKKHGDQAYNNFSQGRYMVKSGQYNQAVQCLSPVVEEDPEFYLAWMNLGTALEARNDKTAAETAYKNAIVANENSNLADSKAYTKYARLLFDQERYDESLTQYNKALEIEPDTIGFRAQILELISKMNNESDESIIEH